MTLQKGLMKNGTFIFLHQDFHSEISIFLKKSKLFGATFVSEHFLLYFERFYFDNDFFKNIPCQEQDQEEEQQNYNNKAF